MAKHGKKSGKKQQPSDPAECARKLAEIRRKPELWGPNEEALRLASNANVADKPETRNTVRTVQRFDVFCLLANRDDDFKPVVNYVRRLENDVAVLHRTQGTIAPGAVTKITGKTQDFAATRIAAGERISTVRDKTGAHSWSILEALIERPAVMGDGCNNWRATVQRVTGEQNHMAQSALVKAAAHNLAGAYQMIDQGERKTA